METNLEHYKEELTRRAKENDACSFVCEHILKKYETRCVEIGCANCSCLQMIWLNEEYKEPKIDFIGIPINTKVIVVDEFDGRSEAYFEKYDEATGDIYISFEPISSKEHTTWRVGESYHYESIELKEGI